MLWGLLIFSRLFFLARYPHFFDSPEYLRLASFNSLSQMLSTAHNPLHPIYLGLLRLARSPLQVSLIAALFGILGIGFFYVLVKELFSKNIARRAVVPLIFFPHLFLLQTNMLHESVEQALFLGSLLMLVLYLKRSRIGYLMMMFGFYYLALMTFFGIIIWAPLLMVLVYFVSAKSRFWVNLTLIGTGILSITATALFSYALLLSQGGFSTFVNDYLFANLSNHFSLWEIARTLRNSFFILFAGFSPAAPLAVLLSGIRFLKNRRFPELLVTALIGAIFYLTAGYWYGGLYGRYSALVAFPLALLLATVLTKKEYLFALGIIFAFWGITVYSYLQKPIPQIQAQLIRSLPNWRDQYLVISDYQRPQLEYEQVTTARTLVVSDNLDKNRELVRKLRRVLKKGHALYFTHQALTFPYYQFDGQSLHIISQNPQGKSKLEKFVGSHQVTALRNNQETPYLNLYRLK